MRITSKHRPSFSFSSRYPLNLNRRHHFHSSSTSWRRQWNGDVMADRAWFREGLRFSCTACGACCTGSGTVPLTKEDIKTLSKHFGFSKQHFIDLYTRREGGKQLVLKDKENMDCIFLTKDKKCSVYKHRPVQCQTYPFWPDIMRSPKTWAEESTVCEGIHVTDEMKELLQSRRPAPRYPQDQKEEQAEDKAMLEAYIREFNADDDDDDDDDGNQMEHDDDDQQTDKTAHMKELQSKFDELEHWEELENNGSISTTLDENNESDTFSNNDPDFVSAKEIVLAMNKTLKNRK